MRMSNNNNNNINKMAKLHCKLQINLCRVSIKNSIQTADMHRNYLITGKVKGSWRYFGSISISKVVPRYRSHLMLWNMSGRNCCPFPFERDRERAMK